MMCTRFIRSLHRYLLFPHFSKRMRTPIPARMSIYRLAFCLNWNPIPTPGVPAQNTHCIVL